MDKLWEVVNYLSAPKSTAKIMSQNPQMVANYFLASGSSLRS